MLNHSRRAPPPAPLIRLFNPNGEERRTQVDQNSDDTGLSDSASESASGSDSTGSFEEYRHEEDHDSDSSDSSKPYFQMRMKWLKGSRSSKHDSLPTSVSSISSRSDFMIPSPRSPKPKSLQEEQGKGIASLHSLQGHDEKGKDDTKPIIDWLVQLADSSFNTDGEVLLFFQSDQDPAKRVRFDC